MHMPYCSFYLDAAQILTFFKILYTHTNLINTYESKRAGLWFWLHQFLVISYLLLPTDSDIHTQKYALSHLVNVIKRKFSASTIVNHSKNNYQVVYVLTTLV